MPCSPSASNRCDCTPDQNDTMPIQYLRLGAGDFKNRTQLSYKRVFNCAAVWWQSMEGADPNVLLNMHKSGKFYPESQWGRRPTRHPWTSSAQTPSGAS
mmetsp:Transcript_41143/g.96119  ORF Transcript_41143/g.96119 Transcript_41143/m.96119 type:complete len:99 (+) Transcript_41143:528-824(+)